MNRLFVLVGAVLLGSACAHDSQGHRVRVSTIRFDDRSVSGPNVFYTREEDGTWAGKGGDRYLLDADEIRKVGAGFDRTGHLMPPAGWVEIDRRPDGIVYTPSWSTSRVWTFVTEDGQPIPRDLEVPLYLTARLGLAGAWVDLYVPGSEQAGVELKPDCALVLFELQGRQVAGWVARTAAICPEPVYPGKNALAKLVATRNEVWESPYRAAP